MPTVREATFGLLRRLGVTSVFGNPVHIAIRHDVGVGRPYLLDVIVDPAVPKLLG